MTIEEIKKKIQEAEASCVNEIMDYMNGGQVDVLVMDVYPTTTVEKALKELGIEKYRISCDNVTYSIYI